MKSRRSRAVAALSIGAAIVTIPLTAGSASAAPQYRYFSTYKSAVACQTAGNTLAQQGRITQFNCNAKIIQGREKVWDLFVR
ncbi:hypothetical protein [Streptomyces milbemycinicus]|uniref:Secreted protein n=1 Tax=Streptomyces milbemycinicus TaxID=476552 RepID=A0ABW8LUF0_9ACTN